MWNQTESKTCFGSPGMILICIMVAETQTSPLALKRQMAVLSLWKPFWFSGRLNFHRHSSLAFAGANALRQKLQNILLTFSQISVTLQIKDILLQRLNLWQIKKYFVQMFIFVTTSKIQRKRTPPLFFRDSYEFEFEFEYDCGLWTTSPLKAVQWPPIHPSQH